MAQRELKVKVSADVDSSLTKLLKVLDSKSNYKINVRLNVDDGGLGKLLKSLDLLSSRANKSSTVRVTGDGSGLNRVMSALDNVERQANKVNNTSVSPSSSGSGMTPLEDALGDAEGQIDQLNNQVIEPRSSGRGLDDLLRSLDDVSSKVLQITAQIAKMALGDAIQSSTDLFDAQKSFANQMGSIGRSDNWINKNLKDLNEYGAKSKYSIAEMVDAFSQFEGAGNKASMALVKGAAGLASYAKKPSQALRGINRQLFQMDKDALVFNRDWNAIRDNIGGAATTALKDWLRLHKGIEVTQDSLKDGALSATDLQEAIVAVGNTDRFQSMAQQVNTVGSAMENLQETITANLVGTLDNEGPLSKFYNGVVKFLNDLTDEVPAIMQKLANGLNSVMDLLESSFGKFSAKNLVNGISEMVQQLGIFIGPFVKLISALTGKGKYIGTYLGAIVTSAMAFKLLHAPAKLLGMFAGGITTLGKALAFLRRSSGGGEAAEGVSSALRPAQSIAQQGMSLVNSVGTILTIAATAKILASAYKDIASIDTSYSQAMVNLAGLVTATTVIGGYAAILGKVMQRAKTLQTNLLTGAVAMTGIGLAMAVMAKSIEVVSKVKLNSVNIADNLTMMIGAITAVGAIATGIGGLLNAIPGGVAALTTGALAITGINAFLVVNTGLFISVVNNIRKLSQALSKVPPVNDIGEKIKNIGQVMAAMAVIGGTGIVTGTIALFGNAIQALANLSVTANLATLKTTLAALNSIPVTDASGIAAKVKGVTNIIATIQKGFAVSGSQGLGAVLTAFGNALQSLANASIAANMRTASMALNELNAIKLPSDTSTITSKINAIKKIMHAFYDSNDSTPWGMFGNIFKGISSAFQSFATGFKISTFKKIIDFADQLANFQVQKPETIKSKIKNIKMILKAIGGGDDGDFLGDLAATVKHAVGAIKNALTGLDVGAITGTFGKIVSFSNQLSKFKPLSATAISQKLRSLKEVIKQLNGFDIGSVQHLEKSQVKDLNRVANVVAQIKKVSDVLEKLGNIDVESKVELVKRAVKAIGELKIPPINKDTTSNAANFTQLTASVEKMVSSIKTITKLKDVSEAEAILDQAKGAIGKIAEVSKQIGGQDHSKGAVTAAKNFSKIAQSLGEIAGTLASLPQIPDDIGIKIQKIKDAMQQVTGAFNGGGTGAIGVLGNLGAGDSGAGVGQASIKAVKNIVEQVKAVVDIANTISALPVLPDDIPQRVQRVKDVMSQVAEAFGGGVVGAMGALSGATGGKGGKGASAVGDIVQQVEAMVKIANAIVNLPALPDDIQLRVSKIANAMNAVQKAFSGATEGGGISAGLGGSAAAGGGSVDITGAVSRVEAIVKIANTLNAMPALADDTTQKITAVKTALEQIGSIAIPQAFVTGLNNALIAINTFIANVTALAGQVQTIAQTLGNNVVTGFQSANIASRMTTVLDDAISQMMSAAARANEVGSRIGQELAAGFDANGLIAKINGVQAAIDALHGKTVYVDVVERKHSTKAATGGMIAPEYRATGGVVGSRWFRPSGTDTVPAMLTPGEFVIKRSVANAIGGGLLNALNNMNINKFMLGMGNKFGVNRTTNNVTNNITQNVDNKTNLVRGMGEIRGLIRP